MTLEAGIVFDYINEIHYTKVPEDMNLKVSDQLIVKTVRSKEVGKVAHLRETKNNSASNPFLKKIIRLATTRDLEREEQNRSREDKAMSIATKKIDNLKLNMTLIRVHYLFDHSRILFYFKAAGKVDFRNLVRELASVFKARIELRQIGVRDEAKMLGGIATCGRPLCCSSWLRAFAPVTVRMAKEQHLSLNPTKISGLCGRLQCCLEYEQNFYETTQKKLPSEGSMVNTSLGRGRLVKANILTSKALILLSDNTNVTVHIDELSGEKKHNCHSKGGGCGGKCPSKDTQKNPQSQDDDRRNQSKDGGKPYRQKSRPKRPNKPPSNNRNNNSPNDSEPTDGSQVKQSDTESNKGSEQPRNSRNNRFNQKKKNRHKNSPRTPQETKRAPVTKAGATQNSSEQNTGDKTSKSGNQENRSNNSESPKPRSRRNRNRYRGKNNPRTNENSPAPKPDKPKPTNDSSSPKPNNKPSTNNKKISENG